MTTKEDAKKRAIFLKKLREEHKETVARTQALLKEQKAVRREICKHIRDEAKAVPEWPHYRDYRPVRCCGTSRP